LRRKADSNPVAESAGSGYVDDVFRQRVHGLTDAREREEEDRLLYVAMTRAEEHLLSFADWPAGARAEGRRNVRHRSPTDNTEPRVSPP
jgi:ATP-dependent exoDNAse (exonuclease V) beta subunit